MVAHAANAKASCFGEMLNETHDLVNAANPSSTLSGGFHGRFGVGLGKNWSGPQLARPVSYEDTKFELIDINHGLIRPGNHVAATRPATDERKSNSMRFNCQQCYFPLYTVYQATALLALAPSNKAK